MTHNRSIAIIGLGYVGLPLAVAFGNSGIPVIAYEVDPSRIGELKSGHDRTGEILDDNLASAAIRYTGNPGDLAEADFYIVAVPTPVTSDNRPDLSMILAASEDIGHVLGTGDIVVYESTVFPGATEEECLPLLEAASKLSAPKDFTVGYSPERINPGDREHRLENIVKIVAAQTPETLEIVAQVYASIVSAGVYRAADIRTAEAAKVIENTQRDLNIALMNELAIIFSRLGIDTSDVLAAAGTKWNFLPFTPGLVGGHCIGVDPFYLTHKAEQVGYHPQVILSGRRINDSMSRFVARETMKAVLKNGTTAHPRVCVLGIAFKPDVPDCRNSKVPDMIDELAAYGAEVEICDPLADYNVVKAEYGLSLRPLGTVSPADAVILAVPHLPYREMGWALPTGILRNSRGVVSDLHGVLDRAATPDAVTLWRL